MDTCIKWGGTNVTRSYVAIYQNKEENYFVYFDFKNNEFFKIAERRNHASIALTAFVGIVLYTLMNDVFFDMTISPFWIISTSSTIGIIFGYISTKLTNRAIEKGLPSRKEIIYPTAKDIQVYLVEGRKQFQILVFAILFLIFFLIITMGYLYFVPKSILMFFSNVAFWIIIILIIWAVRPIKRKQVQKQLKKELVKQLS